MKEWKIPTVENLEVKETKTCFWWKWHGFCIFAPCAPAHWHGAQNCGQQKPGGCEEVTDPS